uniref:Uncharacterized protein n=1 Tax=Arundo donax TaxID=35708 RepID=A0A0A8Z006_ARUDO
MTVYFSTPMFFHCLRKFISGSQFSKS